MQGRRNVRFRGPLRTPSPTPGAAIGAAYLRRRRGRRVTDETSSALTMSWSRVPLNTRSTRPAGVSLPTSPLSGRTFARRQAVSIRSRSRTLPLLHRSSPADKLHSQPSKDRTVVAGKASAVLDLRPACHRTFRTPGAVAVAHRPHWPLPTLKGPRVRRIVLVRVVELIAAHPVDVTVGAR